MSELLEIKDLNKIYPLKKSLFKKSKDFVPALSGVTFQIHKGEVLGLVGESGSGKSTCGKILVRLQKASSGSVLYRGKNINELSGKSLKTYRKKAQMIFQDPYESLNPRRTIFDTLVEPLNVQHMGDITEKEEKIKEVLEKVELRPAEEFMYRYPHELSGGQRQRISIARALVVEPEFIVADEPISMLDASVRASFMNLMLKLKEDFDLTYLFITHDLAYARYICDRLAVIYLGELVEIGPTERVIQEPIHPYTQMLLSAVPVPDPSFKRKRIERDVHAGHSGGCAGCKFSSRCPIAIQDKCPGTHKGKPDLVPIEDGRYVACHRLIH